MKITPHEGKYNYQGGQVCYCDVISVNEDNRSMTVRTIAPPGSKLKDLYISGVKLLSPHSTVYGDEITAIPPTNSRGILIFCEAQPYLLGFFTPDDENNFGGVLTNRQVQAAYQGDQLFVNSFGNYISIRNQGLIEINSTSQLNTFYDPERDLLTTTCQNYELSTNGGSVSWETDDNTLNTNLNVIVIDNVTIANSIELNAGYIDGTNIFTFESGPLAGSTFNLSIANAGDVTANVNNNANLNIANAGTTTFTSNDAISITVQKSGLFSTQQDLTLMAQTNVNITAIENVIVQCKQFLANASDAGNKLGAGAAYSVPLGELLLSALQTMAQTFTTHQHLYVSPGGPDNTSPPLAPMPPPTNSILSQKWQVE